MSSISTYFSTRNPNKKSIGVLRDIQIRAIHGDLFSRFTKNFSIGEWTNYKKIRSVCSQQDLAVNELMISRLNDFFGKYLFNGSHFYNKNVDGMFHPFFTDAEEKEYDQILGTLSAQTTVQNEVDYFLNPKKFKEENKEYEGDYCCEELFSLKKLKSDVPYRVVAYQSALYIVVEEGFLQFMEDKTSQLGFFSEVLKSVYAVAPVDMVNQSSWYVSYLVALQASS